MLQLLKPNMSKIKASTTIELVFVFFHFQCFYLKRLWSPRITKLGYCAVLWRYGLDWYNRLGRPNQFHFGCHKNKTNCVYIYRLTVQ